MKKMICALALLVSCVTSNAQESGVWVEFNVDCGQWLSARKVNSPSTFGPFLIGVVNGLALGRGIDIWRVGGLQVSSEQLFYWMDAYCEKAPLSYVIQGAFAFADERTNGQFTEAAKVN
jgi:hypothetical protein